MALEYLKLRDTGLRILEPCSEEILISVNYEHKSLGKLEESRSNSRERSGGYVRGGGTFDREVFY